MCDSLEVGTLRVLLQPDERIEIHAHAEEAIVAVTNQRVVVTTDNKLMIATPFDRLRRIELSFERERPGTLIIVPESPQEQPQILSMPPDEYDTVAQGLAIIGRRLTRAP